MERVHPLDPLGHSADWTKETTSLSLTGDTQWVLPTFMQTSNPTAPPYNPDYPHYQH